MFNFAGDVVARPEALGNLHEEAMVGTPGAEHSPLLIIDGDVAQALVARREPCVRGVGRMQTQRDAVLPEADVSGPS